MQQPQQYLTNGNADVRPHTDQPRNAHTTSFTTSSRPLPLPTPPYLNQDRETCSLKVNYALGNRQQLRYTRNKHFRCCTNHDPPLPVSDKLKRVSDKAKALHGTMNKTSTLQQHRQRLVYPVHLFARSSSSTAGCLGVEALLSPHPDGSA